MTTSRKKSRDDADALDFLDNLAGGPLTFGAALRAVRMKHELSQADLARLVGVGRQTICDMEKGRTLVSPALAVEYAEALEHSKKQFVRLALQDQVAKAGLKMKVKVEAA